MKYKCLPLLMISALTVFSIFNPHNPGLALVRAEQVENENITD